MSVSVDLRKMPQWIRLDNDSMMPRKFTATINRDRLVVKLEVEVIDAAGHSKCLRLEEVSPVDPNGAVETLPTLASLLKEATAAAGSWLVFGGPLDGGGWQGDGATPEEANGAAHDQLRRNPAQPRNALSQADLEEFAEVYREVSNLGHGGVVEEVASRCGLSRSNAYLRLEGARKCGLLSESEQVRGCGS